MSIPEHSAAQRTDEPGRESFCRSLISVRIRGMTPDQWAKVEEIFHAALEMPAHDRDAYLDRACGNDADLRREVDSLLKESSQTVMFMEEPVAAASAAAVMSLMSFEG